MKFDVQVFAGNIRANRARMKLTQDELSARSGVSQPSIKNYENELAVPSVENACKLADVFGVTLNDLVGC